eukprot:CCRYP_009260-RD/>CCRYP_009260-RD protein AED:0.11 eAED:0.11 QI:166/0.71/0.87/1/0.85/0.75/8/0/1132
MPAKPCRSLDRPPSAPRRRRIDRDDEQTRREQPTQRGPANRHHPNRPVAAANGSSRQKSVDAKRSHHATLRNRRQSESSRSNDARRSAMTLHEELGGHAKSASARYKYDKRPAPAGRPSRSTRSPEIPRVICTNVYSPSVRRGNDYQQPVMMTTGTRKGRTIRGVSLAITAVMLLCAYFWGIETGMELCRSLVHRVVSRRDEGLRVNRDTIPFMSSLVDLVERRRHEQQQQQQRLPGDVAPQAEMDGSASLRGAADQRGGAMSRHDNARRNNKLNNKLKDKKRTSYNHHDVTDKMQKEEESLLAYLGQDATLDFFYAGKHSVQLENNDSIHGESDEDPSSSYTAHSYAILPFSDCNSFVLSVWIYLSSDEGEQGGKEQDNTDKSPRVILSTRTENEAGCHSDLFRGATASPAVGMILYAQPHHDDNENAKAARYRIMMEYATANEQSCRTLVAKSYSPLIREGEWHHVVAFVTEVDRGVDRLSLYIDGDLAAREERVLNRLCRDRDESITVVGCHELLTSDNDSSHSDDSRFDLNGRLGMLAYWETGGPQVLTKQSQRMQVQTINDEEHVVHGINRARFDISAIRELPLQGLNVEEPSLLYTFDGNSGNSSAMNETKLTSPFVVKEIMSGLNGKVEILSPFRKSVDISLDNKPFVPLGGGRYPEYKDGAYVPPKRSILELQQLNHIAHARSLKVKEAMRHLWAGYKKYAWGRDELLPLSNRGQDNWGGMGTTLVDSLSTLWLMDMKDEFWEARDWVKHSLDFNSVRKAVSVFETTIRNLGSLLSAYDVSADRSFLEKADDLGFRLLRAFNTPSGVPYGEVELFDGGRAFNTDWHANAAVLSEIGTLQLEFRYLAYATGKTEYATVAMRALDELLKLESETGLYPTFIHNTKSYLSFANNDISIGAMGDSFYEYLLKIWLQGGKTEMIYRKMYDKAINGIIDNLVCKRNQLTYVAGNMALGAYTHPDGLDSKEAQKQLITGKELAYTCYQMYARGKFGLPPEYVKFSGKSDFITAPDAPYYILRPEASETFFILYHLTRDPVYREWGWEVFRAIDEYCRTESGYAAIKNVDTAQQNNRMESFFPAETLKYLYLLQDNSDKLDLLNKIGQQLLLARVKHRSSSSQTVSLSNVCN